MSASFDGTVVTFSASGTFTETLSDNNIDVVLSSVQVSDKEVQLTINVQSGTTTDKTTINLGSCVFNKSCTIEVKSGTTIEISNSTFEQSCTIGSSLTYCTFENDKLSMTKDNAINFNGFEIGVAKEGSSILFRNDGVTISGSISNHGFKYNQLSFNYSGSTEEETIIELTNPLVLTIYGDSKKERKYTISKLEGNLYVNSDRNSKLIENKVVFQPLKSLLLPSSLTLGTEFPSRNGDIVIVAEDSEVSVDSNSVQKLEKGLLLSSYYNSETQETTQAMFFTGDTLPSA